MKKLILIDAHAIIHRAYHALPPLSSPTGAPINAVYGFISILLRILRELKPDYIAAGFDLSGPTFRHKQYERYKAQRPETPPDLAQQFAVTEEALEAFGIPVFKKEGYEADDIIGTLVRKFADKDTKIIIVTGDMDTLQLVRRGVEVYAMKKGITETVIYDPTAVRERFGFGPEQLIDFRGLKGDPSDNIPGVRGVGEKTAGDLIKKYGTIEKLYEAVRKSSHDFSPSLLAKLKEGEKDAMLSRQLSVIDTDTPIEIDLEAMKYAPGMSNAKTEEFFIKYGFMSLLRRFKEQNGIPKEMPAVQGFLLKDVPSTFRPESIKDGKGLLKFVGSASFGLIPFNGELYIVVEEKNAVASISPRVLASPEAKKLLDSHKGIFAHDAKAVLHILHGAGIEAGSVAFDTMIAAYLISTGERDFSFSITLARELGRPVGDDPRAEFLHFFELVRLLKNKIETQGLQRVAQAIEFPATPVIADMEERGVKIDTAFLEKLAAKIDKDLARITKSIYVHAGEEFNIGSSQQLSRILFEKLKIKTRGLRKTAKGGVISTRESELEKLKSAHPVIEEILTFRELMKLKTTYVDVLPTLVSEETGRLHTTFNQAVTATGRLSSSNPNLQNIPILSAFGREVRKAFVADVGFVLASLDYSQIELRVAAHLAHDTKMIEAFKKGTDIHKMTAAEIYNIPLAKVTPEFRRAAKTLNFGVLYGMGPQAFAEATGFTREAASNFIEKYFKNFSGIKEYVERTKQQAREQGYVETLFGRRRYIPEINSSNWQIRREAERMAVNAPIQGTATGDIVKLAMIKLGEWARKEKIEDEVRLLLQVHDELLFEIKTGAVKKRVPEIQKIMESVVKLEVPLVVDAKIGQNWGEIE